MHVLSIGHPSLVHNALLQIHGMASPRCASSVASALGYVPGVSKVAVSLENSQAAVAFDPRKANLHQFRTAVKAVGFEAEFLEDGMLV